MHPGVALTRPCPLGTLVRRDRMHPLAALSRGPRSSAAVILALTILCGGCAGSRMAMEDPVAAFVRDRMQPGSAAFVIPSPVRRGQPFEAVLRISAPTTRPADLQAELERLSGRAGVGTSAAIRLAPRMSATLVADRDCLVSAKDPAEQAVDLRQGASWRWTVSPRMRGTTLLTVTLSAPVSIDGQETPYRVTSFERSLSVTVTAADVASDLLSWVKEY